MEHGQKQDGFSYYEKRLCILLFLSSLPNSFTTMQTLVTQYTPQHHCALTDVMDEFKTKVWQLVMCNDWETHDPTEIFENFIS